MRPRRVLEIGKSTGGIGMYLRHLARHLDRKRFNLTFLCLSTGGAELAADLNALPATRAFYWPMERFRINPFTDTLVLGRLLRFLRRERFALIHAHGSKAGFLARLAARPYGVPVVYSPHGFVFSTQRPAWQIHLYAALERLAARTMTARVLTVSHAEREDALRHGIGTPELFITVHNGIDIRRFNGLSPSEREARRASLGIPPGAPLVGSVGRLNPQKSPLDFVRLATHIYARNPETHFLWVGDGELLGAAQALSRKLDVEGVLHFPGYRQDIPQILGLMDCFVSTARWESFPLAILEAMAARLPVVAPRAGGIAEMIVHGETGYLTPIGALDEMQRHVEAILASPALAKRLGEAARQRVERMFTVERMIARLSQVYLDVLDEQHLSPQGE